MKYQFSLLGTQPPQGGAGDWSENTTEQNDWAMAVEQSEQNTWSEPAQQQGDDWIDNNDGQFSHN